MISCALSLSTVSDSTRIQLSPLRSASIWRRGGRGPRSRRPSGDSRAPLGSPSGGAVKSADVLLTERACVIAKVRPERCASTGPLRPSVRTGAPLPEGEARGASRTSAPATQSISVMRVGETLAVARAGHGIHLTESIYIKAAAPSGGYFHIQTNLQQSVIPSPPKV